MKHKAIKLQDRRVCRVFFSSPFGGMEDEREILTRKYFPQIHHLCNSHGVQFVAVDMRWGITKEAGESAQVINICLRELDRSDMFVGFFGTRYGWHGKDDNLLQQNFDNAAGRYPWLNEVRHHSVTAVEFMHGHLNEPGARPACFAFRSKDYDNKLHQEAMIENDNKKAAKYASESEYAAKMLDQLKEDIVKTEDKLLGLFVDYKDPEKGAKLMFESIFNYMKNTLLTTENDLSESMRQLAEHDAYLAARVGIYLQGENYLNSLDNALRSEDPQPYLVTGEVGSGKSALLSNWIHQHQDNQQQDTIWLYHFVGAASGSTLPSKILARLVNDMRTVVEENVTETGKEMKTDKEDKRDIWKLLEDFNLIVNKATQEGKKVVIVIDGLNKIQQPNKISTPYHWVPKNLPKGAFMVLSTSSGDYSAHEVFVLEQKYKVLKIQPLDNDTKKELCILTLKENGKELSTYQLNKILKAELTTNPLYLMIVLWELSVFGSFRLLDEKIDYLLEAQTISGLFVRYLERLEEDYNTDETPPDLVQQIMTSLVLSNRGLSENEIQSIFNITSHAWSPLYFALEKFCISHFSLIKIGFKELEQAVTDRYIKDNKSFVDKLSKTIIKNFEDMRKEISSRGLSVVTGTQITRVANELPYFQKKMNDKDGLIKTLMDQHIFYDLITYQRYELLDLIYFTGYKMERVADLFLKSFDSTIVNIYLNRIEKDDPKMKAPGESMMYNLRNMSIILDLAGNFLAHEKIMQRHLSVLENLKGKMDEKKRKSEMMEVMYYLACSYADIERYDDAVKMHSTVIDTFSKMKEEGDIDISGREYEAFATHGIGVTYLKKRDTQKAKEYLLKSVDLQNEINGKDKIKHISEAKVNLGLVELYDGKYETAIEHFNSAMKDYEVVYFGQQPHELGNLYTNIGLAYRRLKNYDKAEQMYRKSLVIKANAVGWDNPVISVTYMNLGTLEMFRMNYQKSLEYNEKCIEVLVKNDRTDEDMYYRMALENIVLCYIKMEKFEEALPAYRRVFDILVKLNQMHNCLPAAHRTMINHLMEKGELEEAEQKLIPLIRCSKSKDQEYITLYKLYEEKTPEQLQNIPDDLLLSSAIKRFPNSLELHKLYINNEYMKNNKKESLIQFLKENQDKSLMRKAAVKLCDELDETELKKEIEDLSNVPVETS